MFPSTELGHTLVYFVSRDLFCFDDMRVPDGDGTQNCRPLLWRDNFHPYVSLDLAESLSKLLGIRSKLSGVRPSPVPVGTSAPLLVRLSGSSRRVHQTKRLKRRKSFTDKKRALDVGDMTRRTINSSVDGRIPLHTYPQNHVLRYWREHGTNFMLDFMLRGKGVLAIASFPQVAIFELD